MDTFQRLTADEPPVDPNDTEKLDPQPFALAGMGAMVTLVSPDGREHWVRKGSYVYRVMKSHGYRVGGAS
jgi:hypothetical protein